MKIYYDTNKIKDALTDEYWGHTPLDLEDWAVKNGWYFTQDDMGECYVSEDEDATVFEEGEF